MRELNVLLLGGLLVACSPDAGTAADNGDDSDERESGFSADAAPRFVIDSLDGEVTQNEVDAFLNVVSATAIPTSQFPNGSHNYLSDGTGGTTLEAINRMYEITGDIPSLSTEHARLLDLAIKWSDTWLTHRNDLPLGEGRVMWTGHVDPIWPPDALPSTYAACEVGETVGILAYTALNILSTRSIWNHTVPDGDPNRYGATYLARAKTYVSMLEFTMDNYFNKYFLDRPTLTIHHPNSAAYDAQGSNNVNAWNREMMFLHAWQTLAQAHEVLGDDPSRAAMYKSITRNTVNLFVKNALPRKAPDGAAVYDWGYGNFGDIKGKLTGEEIGIHAQYDIWGLTRAYRAGYTDATAQQMKTYADTVVHELTLSPGVYASHVDRCCETRTYNYLPAGFMFLSPYNNALYEPAATADIQSGRQKNSATLTAGILWAKHDIAASRQPSSCAPSLSSYQLGKCGGTAVYNNTLYKCISQAVNVNGETSGCGATGVYCSSIPPDDAAWGSTAWQFIQSCN